MHGQDAGDLRERICVTTGELADYTRNKDKNRHVVNRRDWHRHGPLRDGKPSCFMGRTETTQ